MSDDQVTSELILTFGNVKRDLIDSYPPGSKLADVLETINGQLWKIEFYPNGKEASVGNMSVIVTFLGEKAGLARTNKQHVDALCYYSLNEQFATQLPCTTFAQNKAEEDSTINSHLLNAFDRDLTILFGIVESAGETNESDNNSTSVNERPLSPITEPVELQQEANHSSTDVELAPVLESAAEEALAENLDIIDALVDLATQIKPVEEQNDEQVEAAAAEVVEPEESKEAVKVAEEPVPVTITADADANVDTAVV